MSNASLQMLLRTLCLYVKHDRDGNLVTPDCKRVWSMWILASWRHAHRS